MRERFILGFAYYPEHYPEDQWESDVRLMAEAGVQCIRMAEYAWSRMEPREGQFELGWLDRFFELAAKYGIEVILCTPTDAAPPWAVRKYPDIVRVDTDGNRVATCGRRFRCPTSPTYWELSRRIVEQMARRYGDNPQLIGWQTDNEIGGLVCFCDHCRAAFREWCRRKYGTVEAMNDALGMVFWAREYSDWDEVDLPIPLTKQAHPSLQLEIQRFTAHAWTEYCRRQVEVIREHCPGRFVTHNLPGVGVGLDLFDFTAVHDFMSVDMYPQPMINHRWMIARCGLVTNSLQNGPHWVMELTTGSPVTQFYKAPVPRPGQLRLWAHQNAAYGAQGVVFFPWRKRPAGYEMLSNGLLEHDGKPRRYYDEAKRIGQDFARLAEELPAYEAPAEVALVHDFQDRCNAAINPQILGVGFMGYLDQWMRCARRLGLNVRYVRSTDDLTPFRLVIAPHQYTTSDDIAANYKRYVHAGGTLLATQRIGIFNTQGNPVHERMPGKMRDLFGMEIDEYERCLDVNPNRLMFNCEPGLIDEGLESAECRDWVFILELAGAETLATFESEYYAGKPGATVHRYGAGRAVYLGSMLDDDATRRFIAFLAQQAGLTTLPLDWSDDVEVVRLVGSEGQPIQVLLNHALEPRRVLLQADAEDMATGEPLTDEAELGPADVRWLQMR